MELPLGRRRVLGAAAGAVALAAGGSWLALRREGDPVLPARLRLASGPSGAVFLEVAHDLARAIEHRLPVRVEVLTTSASVQNLELLATGRADLAFASLDAAAADPDVAAGRHPAVARLYDSYLHLVVRAASPVRGLADLAGRRVAVGAAGSGTEFTSTRLLTAAGVTPAAQPRLAQTPAMQAVASGTVEAAFTLTGIPTPAVAELAARTRCRLVPLPEAFRLLDRDHPGVYAAATIPVSTYPGLPATAADGSLVAPVTVEVANLLLARPGLSRAAVRALTGAILSPSARRWFRYPESGKLNVRTAIATEPVPLHPGALDWYRAAKA